MFVSNFLFTTIRSINTKTALKQTIDTTTIYNNKYCVPCCSFCRFSLRFRGLIVVQRRLVLTRHGCQRHHSHVKRVTVCLRWRIKTSKSRLPICTAFDHSLKNVYIVAQNWSGLLLLFCRSHSFFRRALDLGCQPVVTRRGECSTP